MFQDISETNSFILSSVFPNIPGYIFQDISETNSFILSSVVPNIPGYIFQDISETNSFILSSVVPNIPGYIGHRLLPVQRSAKQEFHLIGCNKSKDFPPKNSFKKPAKINYFPPRNKFKSYFHIEHYVENDTLQIEINISGRVDPNMYKQDMHTLHKIHFR